MIFGISEIEGIVISVSIIMAKRLPYAVSSIAWYPCPFFRSLCPGSIESSVSVSGHPKNIEGMKSRNVWVIAREVMNTTRYMGFVFEMVVIEEIRNIPIRFM